MDLDRITSYNVCYTKLVRCSDHVAAGHLAEPVEGHDAQRLAARGRQLRNRVGDARRSVAHRIRDAQAGGARHRGEAGAFDKEIVPLSYNFV